MQRLLIAFYALLSFSAFAQTAGDKPSLSVREAHEQTQSGRVILVDIRTPEEWAETGVAKDAYRLDMRDADFVSRLAALRKANGDKPLALICRTANRTAVVQEALMRHGWSDVINVRGGMKGRGPDKGWLEEALPLAKP
jgi:rhodanese-related sulfurtransferase